MDEYEQQRHSRPEKDKLLLGRITARHFDLLLSNSPITALTSLLIGRVLRKTLEDSIGQSMLHRSCIKFILRDRSAGNWKAVSLALAIKWILLSNKIVANI